MFLCHAEAISCCVFRSCGVRCHHDYSCDLLFKRVRIGTEVKFVIVGGKFKINLKDIVLNDRRGRGRKFTLDNFVHDKLAGQAFKPKCTPYERPLSKKKKERRRKQRTRRRNMRYKKRVASSSSVSLITYVLIRNTQQPSFQFEKTYLIRSR